MSCRALAPYRRIMLCLAVFLGIGAGRALAGGGPENVFVVVNSASWASQTVANHFIRLRQIPPGNVFYIDWDEGFENTDADTFRQKILSPVLSTIDKRGLANQIDYVVYSSDFPTAVGLAGDVQGVNPPPQFPGCSINGVTYLYQMLMAKSPAVLGLRTNQYMRTAAGREVDAPSHGFRSWYGWGSNGELLEAGGQHYLLSTMLAVTSGRGNSVSEAIRALERSAAADSTFPKGTVYYSNNADVRAQTRRGGFAQAVEDLKKLGVRAEVIADNLPRGKSDVAGAMLGVADFSWNSTQSTILPGAICEHLTSFGGIIQETYGQTPLSELIRHGAAGASGTVAEPYALQDKFPVPAMHVHYARGCTLAEAFYQSVFGPYQLLIVGDPLCRPWATVPQVELAGVTAGQTVSGTLTIKPTVKTGGGPSVDRFELFVDGRQQQRVAAGESFTLDTAALADGYHELRVVGIESGPIESQGRVVVPVTVANHGRSIECTAAPAGKVRWGQKITVSAKAPGMIGIALFHNGRLLGKIAGEEGRVEVDPRLLGLGPVSIQAIGLDRGGPRNYVTAAPIELTVQPARALPSLKKPDTASLTRGMQLKLASGMVVPVQETREANWLSAAGVKPNERFELEGYFEVTAADVYQFQAWHYGSLKLTVDNIVLYDGDDGRFTQRFLPVHLAPGLHRLRVSGKAGGEARLRLLFGGPGSVSLGGATFRSAG